MKEFRKLRADEIECRVQQVKENGLILLLYKDARCDMRLLDEEVGPENWQCRYTEHKGTLFCSVGIRIGEDWIWKEDAGAASDMEPQKGEASDAFKRACFRWGIGRELYTAPFIWIRAGNYYVEDCTDRNGKKAWKTYDRFKATAIGYDEAGNINRLSIINAKSRKNVFEFGPQAASCGTFPEKPINPTPEAEKPRETPQTQPQGKIKANDWPILKNICREKGVDIANLLNRYGYSVDKPSEITVYDYFDMIKLIEEGKA